MCKGIFKLKSRNLNKESPLNSSIDIDEDDDKLKLALFCFVFEGIKVSVYIFESIILKNNCHRNCRRLSKTKKAGYGGQGRQRGWLVLKSNLTKKRKSPFLFV